MMEIAIGKTLSERGVKLTNSWAKFKNGMTSETHREIAKSGRHAWNDAFYDKGRAVAYFEAMTGIEGGIAAMAEKQVHGEKCLRVRYVRYDDGKKWQTWEIPHWDWNGHAAQKGEAALTAELDENGFKGEET